MKRLFCASTKHILTSKIFWWFIGVCLVLFLFIIFILPIAIGLNIQIFYSNPPWLTTSYIATIIIVIAFSGFVSELVVNKQENVFWLTKDISRSKWYLTKYLASMIFSFAFVIFVFLCYLLLDLGIRSSSSSSAKNHLFNIDIHWWSLLITLLISSILGMNAVILTNFIHWQFVSTVLLVIFGSCFILLFPMIWYVDNPMDGQRDIHRWWYLFYGPLLIYGGASLILSPTFFSIFNKKAISV